MKKNKLSIIPAQIWKTVLRFPVATLCCTTLFVLDILFINGSIDADEALFRWNMLLSLGFVLSVALRLLTEDFHWRNWRGYADVLVIPFLALIYYLLPWDKTVASTYYAIFWLVAITGLCVAPYRSLTKPSLFWQYNMKIWWRILFSAICAMVLCAGLCLALFTIDGLFYIPINEDKFLLYIACFSGCLFAPLFFAAGIPAQSQYAEEPGKPYTALLVFVQYILLPILTLYLLIFYVYGLKIIITWQLPEGALSWLTLIYSVAGLISYFLLHRFYIMKATKITTFFCRYFFYSEIPIIVLLFVAIFRRTADYGITENRYFLWLGAFWLLGITLYMIFTKGKSFRPVLISLACVALLSVVGPWNVFNVSRYSQICRLEKLLAKQEWLKTGEFPNDTQIRRAKKDYRKMRGIEYYFNNSGKSLPPGMDSLYNVWKKLHNNNYAESYNNEEAAEETSYFEIKTEDRFIEITGYDRMVYYSYEDYRSDKRALSSKDSTLACKIKERSGDSIEIYRYGTLLTTFSLPDAIRQIAGVDWTVPSYTKVVDRQTIPVNARYAVVFINIEGYITINSGELDIYRADMYILSKK
ncbi:MAG: DUF4153 domain-containing protein [Prevotellaceae bacterium]|jgi:hypothetical protein|nr:DUF4153 domain-containing protein [Prevotellaceae bacterium]